MSHAKITLSAEELELMQQAGFILTKHAVIRKMQQLLGNVAENLQPLAETQFPELKTAPHSPKISKGENYEELPYVILDYPRLFGSPDTFAIRSMFWWGHYFSIHLQLGGVYRDRFVPVLRKYYTELSGKGYSICLQNDPWEHHFREDNYMPIKNLGEAKYLSLLYDHPFIKIGKKLPLEQWKQAASFFETSFREMLEMTVS